MEANLRHDSMFRLEVWSFEAKMPGSRERFGAGRGLSGSRQTRFGGLGIFCRDYCGGARALHIRNRLLASLNPEDLEHLVVFA
jgi:hypothetical protein